MVKLCKYCSKEMGIVRKNKVFCNDNCKSKFYAKNNINIGLNNRININILRLRTRISNNNYIIKTKLKDINIINNKNNQMGKMIDDLLKLRIKKAK